MSYWQQFRSRQLKIERKHIGAIYAEIKKQNYAFLDAIRKRGYQYAKTNIDKIITPEGVIKVIKRVYSEAVWNESRYIFSSLMKRYGGKKSLDMRLKRTPDASFGVGFDEITGVVDEYFRVFQLTRSGIPITNTTKKYIGNHLLDQVDAGVPLDDAIANFRDVIVDGLSAKSRSRARTIIQTESIRALSFGQLIGAYMTGVDVEKVWVTCADERVRGVRGNARYPHTVLDRQVSTLFGAFMNGEPIKFPGDPDASPENTVMCRCTQFFREKRARPLPRNTNRRISNYLTDFFAGFMISEGIAALSGAIETSDE